MAESHAEALKRFAHDFAVPFLQGGTATVSDFVGDVGAEAIKNGLDVEPALEDALNAQLAEGALLADLTPAPFDADAATLLYAVHELFAACHPQSAAFYSRAHTFCIRAKEHVDALQKTLNPHRLLTRHLIIRRLFTSRRTDTHLQWWTGKASFYGEEAPTRLTAWPGLRRVEINRETHALWRLCKTEGDEETRTARLALLQSLLDISPLTRLMNLGDEVQKEFPFTLMLPYKVDRRPASALFALNSPPLARAVTDALLMRGVDRAGSMLGLSVLTALREQTSPYAFKRAMELSAHLFLMMAIVEEQSAGTHEARLLRELIAEPKKVHSESTRVYLALVDAVNALAQQGVMYAPTPEELPPRAGAMLKNALSTLSHESVQGVAGPMMRELARRLRQLEGAKRPALTSAA